MCVRCARGGGQICVRFAGRGEGARRGGGCWSRCWCGRCGRAQGRCNRGRRASSRSPPDTSANKELSAESFMPRKRNTCARTVGQALGGRVGGCVRWSGGGSNAFLSLSPRRDSAGGAMGRVGDTASAEETARGAILRNLHEARVRLPNRSEQTGRITPPFSTNRTHILPPPRTNRTRISPLSHSVGEAARGTGGNGPVPKALQVPPDLLLNGDRRRRRPAPQRRRRRPPPLFRRSLVLGRSSRAARRRPAACHDAAA
jgi:hypothetical protein